MKVLLIGPLPKPITGQAIAFESFVKNTTIDKFIINTNYEGRGFVGRVLGNIAVVLAFYNMIIFKEIDCIYITTSRSLFGSLKDIIIIFTSCILKVRVINHLHGADFIQFRKSVPSWFRFLIDGAYKKIECSIVLSQNMREQYKCYPDMKMSVVENCFDPSIKSLVNAEVKHEGLLKILYLSNLMVSKGICELIQAVVEAHKIGFKIELDVAGQYFDDDVMSAVCLKNMLSRFWDDNIRYCGVIGGEKKINLLQEADVLALPTYYKTEAQPLCIIEAMASGTYIITTNHNYIRDIVSCENGSMVEPRSVKSILMALINICNDNDRLLDVKKYNLKYASKRFSIQKYVSSIEKVILASKLI